MSCEIIVFPDVIQIRLMTAFGQNNLPYLVTFFDVMPHENQIVANREFQRTFMIREPISIVLETA
jgi:hypothetical protein